MICARFDILPNFFLATLVQIPRLASHEEKNNVKLAL